MIRFLRKICTDRRGNALVITAAALPLLIGSAGLASDTIQWAVWKRQLQRAADSAALAGVHGLVADQTPVATCASGSPVGRDLEVNNHVLLGNGATNCLAENSPGSGPWASDPHAVRVTLSAQHSLGFSSLFIPTAPTITASATATVVQIGHYCVISLEPTTTTGITYQGNATVNLGCGMATNSTGATAVDASGSSSITASPIAAVGGIPNSTNFASGTTVQPYSVPQDDPFADINPPAAPSGACPNLMVNTNATLDRSSDTGVVCFNGMNLQGTVQLGSATYYINGGDFRLGSQANVSCNGCTIILTNSNTSPTASIGRVDVQGSPTINMTAPTSGTYSGILFYQDRRAQDGNGENYINHINGSSTSVLQGAMYFPRQLVTFNGTAGMNTNCVQLVGRRVMFSGNTNITNSCPTGYPHPGFDGTSIRLVA
jgi:hypothetical protein